MANSNSSLTTSSSFPLLKQSPITTGSILVFPKLKNNHQLSPTQFNLTKRIKHPRNAFVVPVVRSQRNSDYMPEAPFYKIEAIVRPWRVSQVSQGLLKMGIRGVTVSDVQGFGAQGGETERHAGSEFSEDKFVAKVKMEIVVNMEQVEEVIDKLQEEARTGEIGDGKIFLVPVSDVIRIRTGERGERAERMNGGRSDMLSTAAVV